MMLIIHPVVDCGAPESIENGQVKYNKTTYKSKATYSCNACYSLEGKKKRSCKQSGVWSKKAPTCVLEGNVQQIIHNYNNFFFCGNNC